MAFEAEQFLTEVLGARDTFRRGDELVHACLLPWGPHEHDDATPGASLNSEKLLYNCFKCGAGGTLLWATETIRGITSAEARKLIQGTFQDDESTKENFLQLLESAWQVTPGASMPHYNLRIIDGWKCYTAYMDARGISREVQREMMTGLYAANVDIVGGRSIVQPRVVIPHLFRGVLRGWTMRLVDDARQVGRKYKHTEEFPKKETLYNFDGAKEFDCIIVVESPMSVLKLKSYGVHNVVATFGAEVNPGQVDLLAKWEQVVLFPDGDPAGYRALSREGRDGSIVGLVHELEPRTNLWVVDHGRTVGEGGVEGFNENDPADYSEHEVRELLDQSVPTLTWGWYKEYVDPKAGRSHGSGSTLTFAGPRDSGEWD